MKNKIDSIADAYKIIKKKRVVINQEGLTKQECKRLQASLDISAITTAFNDGQSPEEWQDWSENNNQSKYLPYFYMSPFRLVAVFDCSYASYAGAGARFYFKRREDAEYCAKQFESLYKDLNS